MGNRKIHTRSTKCQYRPMFSMMVRARSTSCALVAKTPREITGTQLGLQLLTIAILLQFVGMLWLRRLMRVAQ